MKVRWFPCRQLPRGGNAKRVREMGGEKNTDRNWEDEQERKRQKISRQKGRHSWEVKLNRPKDWFVFFAQPELKMVVCCLTSICNDDSFFLPFLYHLVLSFKKRKERIYH